METRIGFGYDSHVFKAGVPLRIGGMPLRIYRGIVACNDRGGQAAFHNVPFCR